MRVFRQATGSLLLSLGAVSCTSNAISITYLSEPRGAMITRVDSVVPVGRSPVTQSYNLDALPEPGVDGCIVIPGVEAVWDSGATARIGRLRICDLSKSRLSIELPRPRGYPGLEIDLEAAAAQGLQRARDRDFQRIGGVEAPRSNPTGN